MSNQHPDSLRFLEDCEKILGREIEVLMSEEYASVDDVIEKARYINGPFGAACTRLLKRNVRRQWEMENPGRHTYVWGYDIEERKRAARLSVTMPEHDHEFPLIANNLSKAECHAMADMLGIKRPMMYDMGYPNNNCIGCVKGGMGYWNKIRRDFPEVFGRRAKQEREIGHSCIKGVYLDELDPDRGNMDLEIFEDCTITCQLLTGGY